MRCVAILGEPASGKTALVQALRTELGPGARASLGLLHYERYDAQKLVILGVWHGSTQFPGTDQLTEAANAYLRLLIRDHAQLLGDGWTILWDGPWAEHVTLTTAKVLADLTVVRLTADDTTLCVRHELRDDGQDVEWLAEMAVRDLLTANLFDADAWPNVTTDDQARNLARLKQLVLPVVPTCRNCQWWNGPVNGWSRCERAATLHGSSRHIEAKAFAMSRTGEGWHWTHADHGCNEFKACA